MTDSLDLRQFYQTFFEEADELLAEMEQLLLELDATEPDVEQLNAIFRAAHSIKGGAATFGFVALTETTHLLENILDAVRCGHMPLRADMIDIFLETKDVLNGLLETYGQDAEPAPEAYERICAMLTQLADEQRASSAASPSVSSSSDVVDVSNTEKAAGQATVASRAGPSRKAMGSAATHESFTAQAHGESSRACIDAAEVSRTESSTASPGASSLGLHADSAGKALSCTAAPDDSPQGAVGREGVATDGRLKITLHDVRPKDLTAVLEEIAQLGHVVAELQEAGQTTVWLETTVAADDIVAVCCFVIDEDQIQITPIGATGPWLGTSTSTAAVAKASPQKLEAATGQLATHPPQSQTSASGAAAHASQAAPQRTAATARQDAGKTRDTGTLRVSVEKVDQIINLVGELVITQAMLAQTASGLDPVAHDRLLNGLELLERNARDLQEAVMSVRMMQMDYVFSRFPRLVRDQAARMGKKVELVTKGRATELDKSLIERIIDPLTHLVRNSLDHGIESPEQRRAAGKPEEGRLVLSAEHHGGNVVIEVSDDGAGLNRERILAKARSSGIAVSDTAADDDVWQLIFSPGFSTAAQVTDLSGRGVGMDVVKRNIQSMGGHVQLSSRLGQGTTTRIILPLTLAILDGMSVRVGDEVFILPLGHVTESLQPQPEQLRTLAGTDRVMLVRGEYLPLIELHRIFDVHSAQIDPSQAIAVIMQAEDRRFALLVDQLVGQHQVVVKSLEANYRKVDGVSAATILGDGSVALIIDVFALARTNHSRWQQVADITH